MTDPIENADSSNGEVEAEVVAETTEKEEEKQEEPKFTDAERRAFARAKVAEAKVKELKAQLEANGPSKKSDGLDYGQKAFLTASGYKAPAEMKLAYEVMKESGKDLEQVLESKYFQAEVESMRELAKTANAVIPGKRSALATDSVEYWLTKPFEEVPHDMRQKVLNAEIAQTKSKGMFYNSKS